MSLAEVVAKARRRKGWAQRELAAAVGRSESWVSQIERGVLNVERLAILQKLASTLEIGLAELAPGTAGQATGRTETAEDLEQLRRAITGHPILNSLFAENFGTYDIKILTKEANQALQSTSSTDFAPLAEIIPRLEQATRSTDGHPQARLLELLTRSYQEASSGFARQGEHDAAWLAGDRAVATAERSNDPLAVVAAHFRLAQTFIRLNRADQAELLATSAVEALAPHTDSPKPEPAVLSLYGAMHLVFARLSSIKGNRSKSRSFLDIAEQTAERLGDDRTDYGIEFGPTAVQLHRVSIAVDLGDAGEALDIVELVDIEGLSPEREMRLLLDTARALIQRNQLDEALSALIAAETADPERLRSHELAHTATEDLLNRSGNFPPEDLTSLAKRMGLVSTKG